jgi:hypothetical protein
MAKRSNANRRIEAEDRQRRSLVHHTIITLAGVLLSGAFSWWVSRASVAAQLEQVAVGREQLRSEQERYRQELSETRMNTTASRFETALLNLSSGEPERRLVGLRSANPFLRDPEYRERMRDALIEAVGRQVSAFARSESQVHAEDVKATITAAAGALRESAECGHLRATIHGLYSKLHAVGALPIAEQADMSTAHVRLREAISPTGPEIGHFLFCKYLPSCSTLIDFDNVMNGTAVEFRSDRVPGPVERRDLPPEALFALNGYPHPWPPPPPGTKFLDLTGPYPSRRRDALISVWAACSDLERAAIVERACSRVAFGDDAKPKGPPSSCAVLRSVRVAEGGWVLRSD